MKRIKSLFILAIVTLFLAGCALSNSQENSTNNQPETGNNNNSDIQQVIVGTSGGPSPYVTTDESGKLDGYDIAVITEIFSRLPQYELTFEVTSFDSLMTSISTGKINVGANNLSHNEEREEQYYFTFPYNADNYIFASHKDNPVISLENAANQGLSYAGVPGTHDTNLIEQYNEDNSNNPINIQYSDAELPVILQQIEGGQDLFKVLGYPVYHANNENYNYHNIVTNPTQEEDSEYFLTENYAYFLLTKDSNSKQIRDDINVILKEMAEDGTIQEISQKYFGQDQTPNSEQFKSTIN